MNISCLDSQGTVCVHEVPHVQPGELHPVQGWALSVTAPLPVEENAALHGISRSQTWFWPTFHQVALCLYHVRPFCQCSFGLAVLPPKPWVTPRALDLLSTGLGDLEHWHRWSSLQGWSVPAGVQFPTDTGGRGCADLRAARCLCAY